MKIRNILFDLDGTLLDTSEGVLESAAHAIRQMNYPHLPEEVLRTFIGPPIQVSFKKHFGIDDEEAARAASCFRDYYKNEALLKARPYEGIYELCQKLREQGRRLAVATYKREDYALTLLKHYHFDEVMDVIHGADMAGKLTKADIVALCIRELDGQKASMAGRFPSLLGGAPDTGIEINANVKLQTGADPKRDTDRKVSADPKRDTDRKVSADPKAAADTLLIGDTDQDALGAQKAGIPFMAVTYGFGYQSLADVKGHPFIGAADTPMGVLDVLKAYEAK